MPAARLLFFALAAFLLAHLVCATSDVEQQPLLAHITVQTHGSLIEGRSVRLEGHLAFPGREAAPQFLIEQWAWDLDNDGTFGESGAEAERGNELDRFATLRLTHLAGASRLTVFAKATLLIGEQRLEVEGSQELLLRNANPEVIIDSPTFETVGSTASVSASCIDAGDDETTVEWDLDNDGNFGETGVAALAGDELGSNVRCVAHKVDPTNQRQFRIRARCRDVDGGKSRIQSADVIVPALKHKCACTEPQPVEHKHLVLLDSAKFHKKDKATVVLSSQKMPSTGALFYPSPVSTASAFELCATYRMDSYVAPSANGATSFVVEFAPAKPSPVADSASYSRLTINFSAANADPTLSLSSLGANSSSRSLAGYPTMSRGEHRLSLRVSAGVVSVWIDGIEVLSETFNLFPASVFGSNAFVGFRGSSTDSFGATFSVDATVRMCQL